MPMWRCPHCGTPQAETARCWVCRRSSTACGTCRHFRRGVAANLGYCGLDPRRQPLAGDEIRACWEAGAIPAVDDDAPRMPVFQPTDGPDVRPRLEFIELEPAKPRRSAPAPAAMAADVAKPVEPLPPPEGRWSLWGDLER
jgi:hypothetical protein